MYVYGDVVIYAILCIHLRIYVFIYVFTQLYFLLIACIIGICWLCIIVSCEFALQILE